MQTQYLDVTNSAWVELSGSAILLSDSSGALSLCVSETPPPINAAAHNISVSELRELVALINMPSNTKVYIKSVTGSQRLTVSK